MLRKRLCDIKNMPSLLGSGKKVYLDENYVYKLDLEETIWQYSQVKHELDSWENIKKSPYENLKEILCPIVDSYYEKDKLIIVMPRVNGDLNYFLEKESDYGLDSLLDANDELLEKLNIDLEILINDLEKNNINSEEALLSCNCGIMNDKLIIFDYGVKNIWW